INRASNELRATRLQLERNRLDLKKQRVEADYFLTRTKRKFERNQVLIKEKLISQQAFDEFKDEYEYLVKKRALTIESQEKDLRFQEQQVASLETSVKRMQANLELVKQQLENLTIKAPVTGHLTSLKAEIGESKNPGQRLGQVDEMDGFKVRAEIDEHYISRIGVGRVGRFDLSETPFELKVTQVFPEVKDGKFEVDLEFTKEEPLGIKRGQTLHIRLQLSEVSEAVLIARGGFYQTTGGNWAYVVDEAGGFAVKKTIRLGRQNPQFFEIIEGLQPGEKVITSTYENFGDMERLILQ
ncbi:MAG: HlyD family efflux transporter periplasmic adaptor subunit, partial [bacterium]|nr:HlyD family efflux transporter periplasmic adaptor subunit [bacterium]